MSVELVEVVEDKNTGLTMNIYRWREGDEWKFSVEVGNRLFVDKEGKVVAAPYNEDDRKLAEARASAWDVSGSVGHEG